MVYRLISPTWLLTDEKVKKVLEGEFTDEEIKKYNEQGYNVYYFPNYPSLYQGGNVEGFHVDTFEYVFVDMDLKSGKYKDKDSFLEYLGGFPNLPTRIVDSGNGIHAYWRVTDLDAKSYLQLQRRLFRRFNTDEAVSKICQLMRLPGTLNTKEQNNFKKCEVIFESENSYIAEQLDASLPPITMEDERYCDQHYNRTYKKDEPLNITDKIPAKFARLVKENPEVREIWSCVSDDRSKADFRLGHIMFASGLSKEEATAVLLNTPKAMSRAPVHRQSYAQNIVDNIWTFELEPKAEKLEKLSMSIKDILSKKGDSLKGTRFPCWSYLDNTAHGFRLGHVIGLVAGSGVGKTSMAMNMFMGFAQNNPDTHHFFVPLEQPAEEIADRWQTMCGSDTRLHDKVHVISNYAEDGSFRHLSFTEIKDYLMDFQKETGFKVGCVVIDHIGALNKKGKNGENQDLMDICHKMKAFARETNCLLIMQSQAPREKAGSGDLELNKDAAYGTMYFEAYCDFLITLWQPLKRCYKDGAPTVSAFKFCKIRHKKQGIDKIQEDVCYNLMFEPKTEYLRELTQDEQESFKFFLAKATNKRKEDRKVELVAYEPAMFIKEATVDGRTINSKS